VEQNAELLERQTQPERRSTAENPDDLQERSGSYAILLALYQAEQAAPEGRASGMLRQNLIEAAQEYWDDSLAPENTRSFHTSMERLTGMDLVCIRGHPERYFLMESGAEVADELQVARSRAWGSRPWPSSSSSP